jgi:hypothetical protein
MHPNATYLKTVLDIDLSDSGMFLLLRDGTKFPIARIEKRENNNIRIIKARF